MAETKNEANASQTSSSSSSTTSTLLAGQSQLCSIAINGIASKDQLLDIGRTAGVTIDSMLADPRTNKVTMWFMQNYVFKLSQLSAKDLIESILLLNTKLFKNKTYRDAIGKTSVLGLIGFISSGIANDEDLLYYVTKTRGCEELGVACSIYREAKKKAEELRNLMFQGVTAKDDQNTQNFLIQMSLNNNTCLSMQSYAYKFIGQFNGDSKKMAEMWETMQILSSPVEQARQTLQQKAYMDEFKKNGANSAVNNLAGMMGNFGISMMTDLFGQPSFGGVAGMGMAMPGMQPQVDPTKPADDPFAALTMGTIGGMGSTINPMPGFNVTMPGFNSMPGFGGIAGMTGAANTTAQSSYYGK